MLNVVTIPGRLVLGADIQTLLAASKLKLFQNDILPDQSTPKSALVEATYSGYAAATLTAWGDPYTDTVNGGVSLTAPSHQFATADPTTVTNTVYGYWLETAGGDLIQVGRFDSPLAMIEPFAAIPLLVTLNF